MENLAMQQIYKRIAEFIENGKEFVIATVVNAESSTSGKIGFKMIIDKNGTIYGTIGGGLVEKDVIDEAKNIFKTHKSLLKTYVLKEDSESSLGMVCGGSIQIFIEYIGEKPNYVIFGAGHIAKKLYEIICLDDTFNIIVCDERPELANTENFPKAAVFNKKFKESISEMPLKEGDYIVLVTAGGKDDPYILKSLFNKGIKFGYIGMIGSLKRKEKCFTKAKELGLDNGFLDKIFAPIGLDIEAETPFEIAISIIAETIANNKCVSNQKKGFI
ncbi:xanthine dehydrogenase [Desulfurella acetivorans A63]|nr:xanthine dehydrogenase [Desulfurella acetivorans A63]